MKTALKLLFVSAILLCAVSCSPNPKESAQWSHAAAFCQLEPDTASLAAVQMKAAGFDALILDSTTNMSEQQLHQAVEESHAIGQKIVAVWRFETDTITDTAALLERQRRKELVKKMRYLTEEIGFDGLYLQNMTLAGNLFGKKEAAKLRHHKKELLLISDSKENDVTAFDATVESAFEIVADSLKAGNANVDYLRKKLLDRAGETTLPLYYLSRGDSSSEQWHALTALSYFLPDLSVVDSHSIIDTDSSFFATLGRLRNSSRAMQASPNESGFVFKELPNDAKNRVFSAVRTAKGETVAAIFNLTDSNVQTTVEFDSLSGDYLDCMADFESAIAAASTFTLLPWQYMILIKKDL